MTAANASSMSDGAAALVLASEWAIREYNLVPVSKITGWSDASTDPLHFTIAPSMAIPRALKMADRDLEKVEIFEINEAFASVLLANTKILGIDESRVNLWGGAISIGHPLGA